MTLSSLMWILALGSLLGLVARREMPARLGASASATVIASVAGMAAGWLVALLVPGPGWLPYALSLVGGLVLVVALTVGIAARRRALRAPTPAEPADPTVARVDDPASALTRG